MAGDPLVGGRLVTQSRQLLFRTKTRICPAAADKILDICTVYFSALALLPWGLGVFPADLRPFIKADIKIVKRGDDRLHGAVHLSL